MHMHNAHTKRDILFTSPSLEIFSVCNQLKAVDDNKWQSALIKKVIKYVVVELILMKLASHLRLRVGLYWWENFTHQKMMF